MEKLLKGRIIKEFECGHQIDIFPIYVKHHRAGTKTFSFTIDEDNLLSKEDCPLCWQIKEDKKAFK